VRLAEFFAVQRRYRQALILAGIHTKQTRDLVDNAHSQLTAARERVNNAYAGIEQLKHILRRQGFSNEIAIHARYREPRKFPNALPSDFAFVYLLPSKVFCLR
jgi:hypothetical protein